MEDEGRGGEEDSAEAIPFVRMGRFQEGKLREDSGSSPKGCAVSAEAHSEGVCVGAFPVELSCDLM